MDEGAAMIYVYKKVKEMKTPEIDSKVNATLDEWFRSECEYELVESDYAI